VLAAVAAVAFLALAAPAFAGGGGTPLGFYYVEQWGSSGTAAGQFSLPYYLATDGHGAIYAVDRTNNRVQKFTTDGTFITKWGTFGGGAGQFNAPIAICVDAQGYVYVGENTGSRVQVFDQSGAYVRQFGTPGSGNGNIHGVWGLAVDASRNVYVSDTYNNRVQVFDSNGAYVTQWNGSGSPNGTISLPTGIAVDPSGNVYVADYINNRIVETDSSGTYITEFGTSATGAWQLNGPLQVSLDTDNNVYVADAVNIRVAEFATDGSFIRTIGTTGSGNGQFQGPVGVTLDRQNNLYVSDYALNNVQKFAFDGTPPEVVSSTDGEWHSDSVAAYLSATDAGSGVSQIWFSLDGSGWTQFDALNPPTVTADPIGHTTDGVHTLEYEAVDLTANWSAIKTCRIKIDTRAPESSVSGVPTGWSKTTVNLRLSARDAGSGVGFIVYWIDGGAVTSVGDDGYAPVTGDGKHSFTYYALDNAVPLINQESAHVVHVNIDSVRPIPRALNAILVARNAAMKFKYKVVEPLGLSPTCTMKIVIKKGTKVVKTIALGKVMVNMAKSKTVLATLPAGSYTWNLYATDLAGNTQLKPAVKKLVVY
jgi:hypothetical protein